MVVNVCVGSVGRHRPLPWELQRGRIGGGAERAERMEVHHGQCLPLNLGSSDRVRVESQWIWQPKQSHFYFDVLRFDQTPHGGTHWNTFRDHSEFRASFGGPTDDL